MYYIIEINYLQLFTIFYVSCISIAKKNFPFSKKIVHFFGFKILSMRRDLSLMLREVCSEKELLTAMNCTPLKKGYIRLRAIYDLMNGISRKHVAKRHL